MTRRRESPLRGFAAATAVGLMLTFVAATPSQAAPLPADMTHAGSASADPASLSTRGKPRIKVLGYPKRLTIGGGREKGCKKSLRVKITGISDADAPSYDLIYAAYVVASPQPMEARRLRALTPGRGYKLYPYPKPEYGPDYKVTLCGTLSSQLLPLPPRTRQQATISIDLVETGSSGQAPVAIRTLQIPVRWNGNAE